MLPRKSFPHRFFYLSIIMQCIDVSMFDVTIKVFSAALNFHGLPNDFDNADIFDYVKP